MTVAQLTIHPHEADQAAEWFAQIAAMSLDTAGVSRPAFSDKETEVLVFLAGLGRSLGLSVRWDAGQNLIVSLPQDADAHRYVLIGSHVDTVPMGGNYDGLAGVLAGFLCLARAQTLGHRFARPVKVLAMRGEESAWFGPCYMSSKALLGALTKPELAAPHKGDGRCLAAHMAGVGIDMAPILAGRALIDQAEVLEYLELHIEQGPLLIGKDVPAAIVPAIRGNLRYKSMTCRGLSGHSGAVPRAFRQDAVMGLADLLMRLDENWQTILQKGDDLVLTSGIVSTDPEHHALSRIADTVHFSLDIRSQSDAVLAAMEELLQDEMRMVSRARGVTFEAGDAIKTPPARLDETLVQSLEAAMARLGLDPLRMASGGGHDAAVFANAGVRSAMVFVRNQNGSHNPDEAMEIEDFLVGASILYEHLRENRS